DPFGNIDTGYTGTVTFTSSDPLAGLPAPFTFGPGDAGVHVFSGTLTTAGNQTLLVSDSVHAARVSEAVTPVLTISGPPPVEAQQPYTLTLSSTPLGGVTITGWTITWGDGTTTTVAGNPSTVSHLYVDPPNSEEISATATTSQFGTVAAANVVDILVLVPQITPAK